MFDRMKPIVATCQMNQSSWCADRRGFRTDKEWKGFVMRAEQCVVWWLCDVYRTILLNSCTGIGLVVLNSLFQSSAPHDSTSAFNEKQIWQCHPSSCETTTEREQNKFTVQPRFSNEYVLWSNSYERFMILRALICCISLFRQYNRNCTTQPA